MPGTLIYLDEDRVYAPPRRKTIIPPAGITGAVAGVYGVINPVSGGEGGQYQIRNAIAGYNVYVGTDQPPDLTTPTTFSATLPINIPLTPPGSGTRAYHIVVRRQNEYGLESQDQRAKIITIDSAGNLVLPTLPTPMSIRAIPQKGGYIRFLGNYPVEPNEEYPADMWRAWISAGAIDVGVDPPTLSASTSGRFMSLPDAGSYSPGTYNVAVALYRSVDGGQSEAVLTTVVLPEPPDKPVPVLGGYEE